MADVVTPEKRSQMMAGIRGKNTKPELLVRQGLHRLGYRYRLHDCKLPGSPDIVLHRFKAAIFVHGCFWHGHHCHLFKWPKTRAEFWREKIDRNAAKDLRTIDALELLGWRVAIIWECSLRGRARLPLPDLFDRIQKWLGSDERQLEIGCN